MLMSEDFEKNDRLEVIKQMILEEEAVGEPIIFKITVLQSVVKYEMTAFDNEHEFQNAVVQQLQETHPFEPRKKSQLREGFLNFSRSDNKVDCYYIREMPFRWDYVNVKEQSIESLKLKRVDPTYRVRVNISFETKKVVLTFFGGIETLVFQAREMVCDVVKKYSYNFAKKDVRFTPQLMRRILEKFGKDVELINIDPRDNIKFSKIVEQKVKGKAEVKKVIIYDVFNVRMAGISITISPEVTRIIEEEGIRLTEIRGGFWLQIGLRITTKVKSNGRIEFTIPSKYFGNDQDKIYEVAVKLYQKVIPSDLEPEKGPLEQYL